MKFPTFFAEKAWIVVDFTPNALSNLAIITAKGKDAMPYIQDFTKAMCQTQASSSAITVQDRGDGQNYTVRYINGNCWMTRNLAIGCNGTGSTYGSSYSSKQLTSDYSNVSTPYTTPTISLDAADGTIGCSTTGNDSNCNSYTEGRMKCSSSYGAWYNYATASAGTVIANGSTYVSETQYSVCPAGWTLPTQSQFNSINTSSYKTALQLQFMGGWYRNGSLATDETSWWSKTPFADSYASFISSLNIAAGGNSNTFLHSGRHAGFYVRCIRST